MVGAVMGTPSVSDGSAPDARSAAAGVSPVKLPGSLMTRRRRAAPRRGWSSPEPRGAAGAGHPRWAVPAIRSWRFPRRERSSRSTTVVHAPTRTSPQGGDMSAHPAVDPAPPTHDPRPPPAAQHARRTTDADARRAAPALDGLRPDDRRAVHGHPRRVGGERRAAVHQRGPAPVRRRLPVDDQRLRAALRRPAAARRPHRRPARPAPARSSPASACSPPPRWSAAWRRPR